LYTNINNLVFIFIYFLFKYIYLYIYTYINLKLIYVRRKWLHCFDNVSALLFIVNLSGYNSVLFEDNSVNRMKECFDLFKQTANNEIFKNTPIFLLFNKKDLFEEKIRTDSINICEEFADYTGNIIK